MCAHQLHRSFSTLGCPEKTWDEAIDLACRYQIPSIEIRTLRGSTDLAGQLALRWGTPQQLRCERTQEQPIAINCLGSSAVLFDSSQKSWQELLELAPWADALNIKHLRIFDGESTLQKQDLTTASSFFQWWHEAKTINNWKVEILVETHSSLLNASLISRLQESLDAPANLLWDAHHTWFKGFASHVTLWPKIQKWVRHIHIKDSQRPTLQTPRPTYCLPGKGEFPIRDLLKTLSNDRFTYPVSLEWEKFWHPELPSLERALKDFRSL